MNKTTPQKRTNLRCQEIDGEYVVLDRDGGWVHQLNTTARFVWDRLDGRHSVRQIAEDLHNLYDVSAEQARRDVAALLSSFEAAGLLHDSA